MGSTQIGENGVSAARPVVEELKRAPEPVLTLHPVGVEKSATGKQRGAENATRDLVVRLNQEV